MRAKRMKNMERTEGAEPSFNEIIDVSDDMRRRRGRRRKTVAMRVSAALLIVISICIGGFPAMLQYRSAHELSNTSDRSARAVAGWPYPQADDAIAAAKEYNKRLAASGQPILGEAKDPFSQAQGQFAVQRIRFQRIRQRQRQRYGISKPAGFRQRCDGHYPYSENLRETADLPWHVAVGTCVRCGAFVWQ